jgi:hypothetical protein
MAKRAWKKFDDEEFKPEKKKGKKEKAQIAVEGKKYRGEFARCISLISQA